MSLVTPSSTNTTPSRRFRDYYDPFEEFFNTAISTILPTTTLSAPPPSHLRPYTLSAACHMDIIERPDHYQVNMELPGVRKEDIRVDFEGNRLYVQASKREEHKEETDKTFWTERQYGTVKRTVELPSIDPAKVLAKYEDGILKVMVGKSESAQKKSITVS